MEKKQYVQQHRALFGLGLAIAMAAALLAVTIGALSAAQPVYAHDNSPLKERADARLAPAADTISISKFARTNSGDNAVVFNGQPITYTIVITNNSSTSAATAISVLDVLPPGALDEIKCITVCQPIFTEKQIPEPLGDTILVTVTTQLSWTVASLAPLATTQLVFTARVEGQTDGTVFKNRAFATYMLNGGSGAASTPDVLTTVRAQVGQTGQPSLADAPTWFSADLGGTLSQDWGDFNGDGQLDLVLGSSLGVSVYINQNGQLKPYWNNFSSNLRAYGVRWADFNKDGKLEIVAVGDSLDNSAVTSGTNYIFGPTPNGFAVTSNFISDYQMVRVAVGKFSSSGNIDIVASTNTLNAACPVRLFRNNGSGAFSGPGECVSTFATAALGPGDFDNNGSLDLAVGLFPNTIEILRNNGNGVFTVTAPVVVDNNVPFLPYDFAWGDFDNNGLLDLAAAFPLQKEARVYRNLGGVFDAPLSPFRTNKFLSPLSVTWGDFNGDGALDLAVADDNPKVYLNHQGTLDQSDPLAASTVAGQVWSLRAEQVDNSSDLQLSLSNRDAASLLFDSFGSHLSANITQVNANSQQASSLATGDADGNGTVDLVFGAAPLPVQGTEIDYNTAGSFPTQLQLPSGPGPQSVAVGDVDGHGSLDVAVGTAVEAQLYLSGQTVTTWTGSAPNGPNHIVAFCDVNSDGRLDLLVGANGSGVGVYLNVGGDKYFPDSPSFTTAETGNVKAIACADVRHNHYSDFAVAFDNQPVQLYNNNLDGTFSAIWNSGTHSHTTSLAWGDFNLDGYSDLTVGNRGQGTQIYENIGGHLQTQAVWTSPTQFNTTAIAWGDWNNDGKIDLAIGNDGQPAQVFGNLGSTPGQPRLFWLWTAADSFATTGVAWGDFEGDGHLDLGLSQSGVCCNGFYRNGTVTASHLNSSFVSTLSLPNNPTYVYVPRPGNTADGYTNSSSEILGGPSQPTVTVAYTLYDANGSRRSIDTNAPGNTIIKTNFEYSLDGGSHWLTATAAAGSPSPITTTSRLGQTGSFIWDILKDKAVSEDARFRVRVVPFIPVGPVETASAAAVSPPFRVHGVTCVWPENPTITVSQNPISPTVPAGFFGSISAGSGPMTYTWSFGDGSVKELGVSMAHIYSTNGIYTVTLTVSGQPCPQNRDVVVTKLVQVGQGKPGNTVYLPMVSNGTAPSQSVPDDSSAHSVQIAPQGQSGPAPVSSTKVQALPQEQPSRPQAPALPNGAPPVTGLQVTTSTVGINNEPSVNGDGTRVAFWSTADTTGNNPDGNIELYLLITDTGGLSVTQITSSTGSILGGFNLSPSIDRAGARVAFFSDRDLVGLNPDFNFEVFYYNVNTAVLTQLTRTDKGFNILPSISGDGQYIAFASDRDLVPGSNTDGNTEIFRAQILPGGGITFAQVTHTTAGVNDQPRINDDGTRIAFVSDHNLDSNNGDNNREVFLATIGSGGAVTFRQISNTNAGITGEPAIDSDGQRVAFVSNHIANSLREIYYADVDSSNNLTVTRVTTSATEVGNDQPSISGDGTRIVFISPNIGQVRVFDTLLGADLTATVGTALNPSISGDGTVLVYALNQQLYTIAYRLARLTLTKSVTPGLINQDQLFTYTVVLRNFGPSPATNIILTDTLGAIPGARPGWLLSSKSLAGPAGGSCSTVTGSPITCTLSSLPANTSMTLTVAITPTTYGTLTNTASVSTLTPQYVPAPDASVTVTIQPLPVGAVNLELTGPTTGTVYLDNTFLAVVSPITASVPLTYSWTATNQLPRTFTSTVFTDSQVYVWNPGGVQMVTVTVSNAANNVVTATKTITIFNPRPVLTSTFPTTATFNDPQLTLVVTGTGFVANSTVLWNNTALATSYGTSATLQAIVPAANLTAVGTYTIAVFSPGPGGGLSGALPFVVEYAAPNISSISPITAATGGLTFTLTINGSDFISGASLYFDGKPALPTVFGSASLLTAQVPFSYLLTAGTVNITVTNPSPSVGPSNVKTFTIVNPSLTLSVNPSLISVGQTATLTATISDLQAVSRVITLTTSNSSIASLPATVTLPAQSASVSVTVQGGVPGSLGGTATLTGTLPANIGGDSGSTQLTVSNPTPTISQANPLTTTAGGLTFTLTLTGSNFLTGALLYWDNQAPLALVGSGSAVSASIPASYIATPETAAITVTNQAPSNGASAVFNYSVVSPTITLTPSNLTMAVSDSAMMTVTISAAQFGSRLIDLDVSSFLRLNVPNNVTLPAQTLSVSFTVSTRRFGGVAIVTATLPISLGGQFDTSTVTIANPGPTIGSITPNPITVTVPVTLDVLGTGFISNTIVSFAGKTLTQTEILSDLELTATVPVDLYPIAGDYALRVTNPSPGGGSFTATVTAVNPTPVITLTAPITATAGDSPFVLGVAGGGFISGTSTVYWNGSPKPTIFVNSWVVGAIITTTDLVSPDIISITVVNTGPGGGVSNSWPFTITTSQPTISAIAPNNVQASSAPFTLVVTGTNFVTSTDPSKLSTIQINGAPIATVFNSSTNLTATVDPALSLPNASVYTVTVLNPDSPGPNKLSNGQLLTATNPAPTVITMTPTIATAGVDTTLIVTGTNFVPRDSVVLWNNTVISTAFNSSLQLTASLSPTLLSTAGSFTVTVRTTGPGGGTAAPALLFEVGNKPATLTSLSPVSKNAGSNTFTIVVTGTDFVTGAMLEWNSITQTFPLATTLITGTTRATAPVPTTRLVFGGYYTITLRNPAPPTGGIESTNFLTVAVNNPQPVISTISPTTTVAGTAGPTITITGTGNTFTTGVMALWNGAPRLTTFTDGNHLQMTLNAADVSTVGIFPITVQNPDPSLGISAAKNFTVTAPTITLTPSTNQVITLPANGSLNVNISDIQANNTVITLTSSSQTTIAVSQTVTIIAGNTQQSFVLATQNVSGSVTIQAQLPVALGGGVSNIIIASAVDAPITGLAAINNSPTTLGQSTLLTATKTGGTNVSYIWNFGDGSPVSAPSANNFIGHTYGGTAGNVYTAIVTATNSIGTQVSATTVVTINNPVPAITGMLPLAPTHGITTSVTLTGTGFISGAIVKLQLHSGLGPITSYSPTGLTATQITLTIPGTDISTATSYDIWVANPAPPSPDDSAHFVFTTT